MVVGVRRIGGEVGEFKHSVVARIRHIGGIIRRSADALIAGGITRVLRVEETAGAHAMWQIDEVNPHR
ncbi:hypothetical protein D3C87_1798720 [compost metagenome]